jgi:hypothetical protein
MVSKEVGLLYVSGSTLDDVLRRVQQLIRNHGGNATVNFTCHPYSDGEYVGVFAEFPESDEEMATRLAQEQHYQMLQEQNDLEEYHRLRAKFGRNNGCPAADEGIKNDNI